MRMIDAVDDSYIVRKASYGMLQDEVSKYSLRLSKINLKNAFKPKVYNIKNAINPSLIGKSNSMGMIDEFVSSGGIGNVNFDGSDVEGGGNNVNNNVSSGNSSIQTVKIPFPVLVEKFNVIGKSDNTIFDNKTFFANSRIQIVLYPFDNIVKFVLASGESTAPEYMDLTIYSDLSFVIRNDFDSVTFPLYDETEEIQLDIGQIVFKLDKNKYNRIKSIYDSGINVFYIIGTNQDVTSVVYNGLFKIFETKDNIDTLNDEATDGLVPSILDDPNLTGGQETAVVTRRTITEQTNPTPRNNS
jgi:hypothetical protein